MRVLSNAGRGDAQDRSEMGTSFGGGSLWRHGCRCNGTIRERVGGLCALRRDAMGVRRRRDADLVADGAAVAAAMEC